jgi:hypothetical protein
MGYIKKLCFEKVVQHGDLWESSEGVKPSCSAHQRPAEASLKATVTELKITDGRTRSISAKPPIRATRSRFQWNFLLLEVEATPSQESRGCFSSLLKEGLVVQSQGQDQAKVAPREQQPRRLAHPKKSYKFVGVPDGIRTRVTAVKGRCPRPLDDGDAVRLPGRAAGRRQSNLSEAIKQHLWCQKPDSSRHTALPLARCYNPSTCASSVILTR